MPRPRVVRRHEGAKLRNGNSEFHSPTTTATARAAVIALPPPPFPPPHSVRKCISRYWIYTSTGETFFGLLRDLRSGGI